MVKLLQNPMKVQLHFPKPARTVSGLTRSALPLMTQSSSGKSAMCRGNGSQGGCILLRIGSLNVHSMRGKDGEVVNMSGLLFSPGDKMERRGC